MDRIALNSPAERHAWTLADRAGASSGWDWHFRVRGPAAAVNLADSDAVGVRSDKAARLEAALFVAEGALSIRRLMQSATLADTKETKELIAQLNGHYDAVGSAFRIERVAGGFRLLTRPVYARWLGRIHQRQSDLKLSPPAMETLTIVAYCQPVTRADVEAIRGVQSTDLLKQLMERGLIKICGEENSLGRPYLYDTTRKFLELFGLRSLKDLPSADTLRRKPAVKAEETPDVSAETANATAEDGVALADDEEGDT